MEFENQEMILIWLFRKKITRIWKKLYPNHTVDLFGDLGIKIHGFELWTSITRFDYEYLSERALEEENIKIISLEKLLFLTALAMDKPKYHKDLEMIVAHIMKEKYPDIII